MTVNLEPLPGLADACRRRNWTASDLAVRTGFSHVTAHRAIAGKPISAATRKAIVAALEACPVSAGMRELMTGPPADTGGQRRRSVAVVPSPPAV